MGVLFWEIQERLLLTSHSVASLQMPNKAESPGALVSGLCARLRQEVFL
jgi:hypothetical protein